MINNLIIDGNYIFHKAIHSLKNTRMFYTGLYDLLDMSIKKYAPMNTWDNIVVVSDSRKKSWRTKIESTYKGTRERDESVDWDFAYETYEKWKSDVSNKYIFFQEDHIEGDDWVFFLIKYFNKKGTGNLIISADRDLNQLLVSNCAAGYMNIQTDDKINKTKLYIPYNWKLLYNEMINSTNMNNPFLLSKSNDKISFFDNMCKICTVVEINNTQFIFEKILQGDVGDNVMSVHNILTKTGSVLGIGQKTAEKTWNEYNKYHDTFKSSNNDDIQNMLESYETVKKKKFDLTTKKNIHKNILHNINMMELKISSFPNNIVETITTEILKKIEYND